MFHTYVDRAVGDPVDFDRASYLMDKELLAEAIRIRDEYAKTPESDVDYGAQYVWGMYTILHEEKYGTYFLPHINPNWK